MSRSSAASGEPTPSASPSLTASAEATAAPSASAEPSEPQQAALGQGWGRIDIAVNLRDGPGPSSAIETTLREGDVVWVNSQPEQNGGRDWYYVMTLNNTRGWIASGPANAPYATTISNRYVYNACGQVSLVGNYGVVDGLRTIRLERLEQGTFELAAAMAHDRPRQLRENLGSDFGRAWYEECTERGWSVGHACNLAVDLSLDSPCSNRYFGRSVFPAVTPV